MKKTTYGVLVGAIVILCSSLPLVQHPAVRAAVPATRSELQGGESAGDSNAQREASRAIPTTSKPVGNGLTASRTYANTSFELKDSGCTNTNYEYAREADVRGWLTTSPSWTASCNGVTYTPNRTGRVIELQPQAAYGYTPQHGSFYAELNAQFASMLYQPICFKDADVITYSFAHRPRGNRTDVAELRIGIPTGLPVDSRPANTYSRQIAQASTVAAIGVVTGVTQTAYAGTASTTETISPAKWGVYTGVHTLPATGWDGIRNVGFVAISGEAPTLGNMLDAITMGLSPLVDLGASRDKSANERSTPTALKIRINGRIAAGTKIALTTTAGDATPDSDYRIGSVTAGDFGSVTTTHTTGTNVWVFDVPAGDYDGGVTPANDTGGLTVPIIYDYDLVSEGTEYVRFAISNPGVNGATTDWAKGDPTCDTSEKNDGVVYSIVNVNPTVTPTKTVTPLPSNTKAPTATMTPTPIPFLLKKGAIGASFVLGLLQNNTLVTWGMNREYQANIPPCCGSNIQDIAVGTNFALALKGGRVYGWGANTKGQLKIPTTALARIKAVGAGGAHGLALTTAGKVIAWGDNKFTQAKVPALSKVVKSVVGGNDHTVVLFTDGTVKAWGANTNKQSSPPTTLKGITQIAAGLDHNLALRNDGTVTAWGGNTHGQSVIPPNAIDIKQVSAGTQFSMAVKKDGSVLAWGRNDYNQIIIPTEYTDIYSAFAGYANTILGLRSGRVIVLGAQTDGIDVSRTPTKTVTPTP